MGLHQFSSCELLFLLVMLLFFFDEGLAILSIWRFFHNDWRWIAGIVHLLVIGTIRHVDSETTDSYNTYILWESMAWYTSPTLSLSVVGMCSGLPQVRYIIGLKDDRPFLKTCWMQDPSFCLRLYRMIAAKPLSRSKLQMDFLHAFWYIDWHWRGVC